MKAAVKARVDPKVRKAIKQLPKFTLKTIDTALKRDAQAFIKTYQEGINKNSLQLKSLSDSTVRSKRSKGYQKPKTPLYGKGLNDSRSLINQFIIRKLKSGYRVATRTGNHWSGLKMQKLAAIMEYGATINRGGSTIVIPPRPARSRAFQKWLRARRRQSTAQELKRAITEFINTASSTTAKRIEQQQKKTEDGKMYA